MEQEILDREKPSTHLGKSEHGIYYTALYWHQLQIWVLHEEASESCPIPKWELKHKTDTGQSLVRHFARGGIEEIERCWSLEHGKGESDDEVECGWDSSSDDGVINVERENVVDNGDDYLDMDRRMNLLGYHPNKEIAFLGNGFEGFAYYLSSSKLQYLGTFYPNGCNDPRLLLHMSHSYILHVRMICFIMKLRT
jgi:hypothetical protein